MFSLTLPLQHLLLDLEAAPHSNAATALATLPQDTARRRIQQAYDFLPPTVEVQLDSQVQTATITHRFKAPRNAAESRTLFNRASKFAAQGDYKRAITHYQQGLGLEPTSVIARRNLGMALLEAGQLEAGRQRLLESTRLSPDDTWSYLLLGLSYTKFGSHLEPSRAQHFYDLALSLNPHDPFVLNSYGGTLMKLGHTGRARELLEQAYALSRPTSPTERPQGAFVGSGYGLALVDFEVGQFVAASQRLSEMLRFPQALDVRTAPVYSDARELVLQVNATLAESTFDEAMALVERYRQGLEAQGGIPIEVVQDATLDVPGRTAMTWNTGEATHRLLHQSLPPAKLPHTLVHLLEHIALEFAAREVGRHRILGFPAANLQRALYDLIGELYQLQCTLHKSAKSENVSAAITPNVKAARQKATLKGVMSDLRQSLTHLHDTSTNMLAKWRLYHAFPPLRASQLLVMDAALRQTAQYLDIPEVKSSTVPTLYGANAALGYAYALFADWLFEGQTDWAGTYQTLGGIDAQAIARGTHILGVFQKMMGENGASYQPGDQYTLTDTIAQYLGLSTWYEWCFQCEDHDAWSEPLGPTDHEPEPEDFEVLREGSREEATVGYMVAALRRFESLSNAQVETIAFEVSALGRPEQGGGFNVQNPDVRYHLRTLKGEPFTGVELFALMQVAFARVSPGTDLGLGLDEPYREAMQRYLAKKAK